MVTGGPSLAAHFAVAASFRCWFSSLLSHFFQDDAHLTRKRDLTLNSINLNEPGIKIFDFHPIHIFLNSPSIEFYQSSKINFHNFELLKKDIFDGVGIRDIFLEVIKLLSLKKNSIFKLRDII